TYTGNTVVQSNKTLVLGKENTVNSDSNNLTLNSGTIKTSPSGAGFSNTFGTLNIESGNGTIALGTGNHSLKFSASNGVTWNGSSLTIIGWTGTEGISGTAGKIFVGNNASGLTSTQLAKFRFTGYPDGAQILSTGEVVPLGVITYTVTFDKNHADATGTMANQTASSATALTTNAFVRAGYVFTGWNTVASGVGGTAYADGASFPFTANTTLYAQWVPVITNLADNGSPIAAGNITQGTNNNIIASFTLTPSVGNSTLTSVSIPALGTYVAEDINGNGFKLWYNTTNTFGSANELKATASTSIGSGETILFSNLSQTLTMGNTGYFWVTSNIIVTATPGNTLSVGTLSTSNFTVEAGTKAGVSSASGTKTIIATAVPTISVTPATLEDFGSVCLNTDSTLKSYTLTGVNLTTDVVITAPAGFKIRKGVEAFSSSTSVTPSAGNVNTTIDVIYSPTVAGASGTLNISHESAGATTKNVSVSGTGIIGTVAVTTQTISTVSTTAAESGGTTVSTTCGTITAKGVVWGTAANPTIALSTKTNDGTGVGDYSSSITGLTENTLYNVRAYATNSHAVTSYGSNLTFTTLSKAPTAPIATTATVNGFTASWTAPADQGAAAITYTVKIYSNNTLTTQVGSAITGITGTSTVITSLSQNTTYYYTVEAVNATGSSAVTGFTTGITTLSGPIICGYENFETSSISTSYGDGSFTGNNNIVWNYYASRNEDTFGIDGKGIMLRRSSDNSRIVSAEITNGIGDFTCKLKKAFTGSGDRQVQLYINGIPQTASIAWDNETTQTYTVNNINISGNIIIEIRNTKSTQVIIDDIKLRAIITSIDTSMHPVVDNII
ncbi:MAG: hypothetical protein EOO89_14580, partial [Pedobacter sp.]